MSDAPPGLEALDALVGTWTTSATHPTIDGPVPGETSYEWLAGGRFLVQRSRNDHEHVPDPIAVIGAPEDGDGLVMEYFDSRGVRRTYGAAVADGELRLWRDDPVFAQRYRLPLGGDRLDGLWQVAETPGDWRDDLRVVLTRRPGPG